LNQKKYEPQDAQKKQDIDSLGSSVVESHLTRAFDEVKGQLESLGFQMFTPSVGREMSGFPVPEEWVRNIFKGNSGLAFRLNLGLPSSGWGNLPPGSNGKWRMEISRIKKVPAKTPLSPIFSLGSGNTLITVNDGESWEISPQTLLNTGIIAYVHRFLE
jgi:hypothetical protein